MQVIRHILATLAALVTWLLCATVAAQTTQPATTEWPARVEQLIECLVAQDVETAGTLLTAETHIHRFQSNEVVTLARLTAAANEGQLVSLRHYIGLPDTLAADLQQDLAGNQTLPEDVRGRFELRGDDATARANQVAANWVKSSIRVEPGSPLSVVVLWTPEPVLPSAELQSYQRRLIFILLRGESSDNPRIVDIAYGFPGRSRE